MVAAMCSRWDEVALDAEFLNKRRDPTDHYLVLHDTQAMPQPGPDAFPYCVFEQAPGPRGPHQSYSKASSRQLRTTAWQFRIHASDKEGSTGKEIAAALADKIMQAFDNYDDADCILLCRYDNDYSVRTEDSQSEWTWIINYVIFFDAAVNT